MNQYLKDQAQQSAERKAESDRAYMSGLTGVDYHGRDQISYGLGKQGGPNAFSSPIAPPVTVSTGGGSKGDAFLGGLTAIGFFGGAAFGLWLSSFGAFVLITFAGLTLGLIVRPLIDKANDAEPESLNKRRQSLLQQIAQDNQSRSADARSRPQPEQHSAKKQALLDRIASDNAKR